MGLALDTQNCHDEHLCKAVLKSTNEWTTSGTNKLYYADIWPLILNSDLDLWAMDMGLARDTPTHYGEHLWQGILKSPDEWQSYSPDKLYYTHIWPLISKCDLDLWAMDMGLARDTPTHHGEHLCPVILKSPDEWQSYSPDKIGRTDARTYTQPPLWQLSRAHRKRARQKWFNKKVWM